MIKIRTESFCSLARNGDWRKWLSQNAPNFSQYLEAKLKKSTGCRENKHAMVEIHKMIYGSGNDDLVKKFEDLIKNRFSYVLSTKSRTQKKFKKPGDQVDKVAKYAGGYTEINKHNVFQVYRPHLFTIPHKLIIVESDPNRLKRSVDDFVSDKPKHEYIILDDRAYIEYLPPKMTALASEIPDDVWEVATYRKNHSVSSTQR